MNKIRVAVIGAGSMGRNHARIYMDMDDVSLVGICDTNEQTAKNIAGKYGVPFYSAVEVLLSKEKPDAVSIAVPTHLHYSIAKLCIEAKFSVLIEKPIASTIEQAQELISLAKKHRVILCVGHTERFNPAIIELKQRLVKGEIGKIYKISASRLSPFPTRIVDMGVIIDLAVHDLDVFSYLLDDVPSSIKAVTERHLHKQHEDICIATLRFKNGIVGVLNLDRLTPVSVRQLFVTGEKGMFEVNYLLQDLYLYKNIFADKNSTDYTQHIMGVSPGDVVKIQINKKEPLRTEIETFIIGVRTSKQPQVTGKEALVALQMAHAVLKAAEEQ
ncbi:MAG: Gfo/Idh/MocA family oxidoreductase [Nanoarchaeota archaeon]